MLSTFIILLRDAFFMGHVIGITHDFNGESEFRVGC